MNLNPHHYRIYLCVQYVIFAVKNVKPPFFIFLWLLRAIKILNIDIEIAPRSPLLNVNVFIFCAKVRIWNDLREKYGTKFGLLIFQKNVDFKVDNN